MAIDADGNFYNPYSPGSYEYEMEEGTRGQEPTPGPEQTFYVTPDPLRVQQPTPPAGFNTFNQITGLILSVATMAVPGLGEMIGASILEGLGVSGASAAVKAGVGAASLSAGSTAAQGGSVEDVLKSGVSAGIASGLNVGIGGGVPGSVAGSAAGTVIKGGDVSQVITNALAAGVGAGVQGALPNNPDAGKIIGSAARTYISTGGNLDKTLLNTAVTAIGTLDQPTTYAKTTTAQPAPGASPFQYGNDTYQELDDGTAKVTTQSGNVRILSAETFNEIKQDYASDVASGAVPSPSGPVIPPQTISETAPTVSPTVTDVDVIKQIQAQQQAVPETIAPSPPPASTEPAPTPASTTELEKVAVNAPSEPDISPVVTDLDLIKQVAQQQPSVLTPEKLEQVIVQGQKDTANVAPVETGITTPRPDTTRGIALPPVEVQATTEKLPEPGFEEYKPLPEKKVSDVVTDATAPVTGPSLDQVTVTGTRDLVDPFVDIAPPPAPTELSKVEISAPPISPEITDLDLVKQVAAQPTPTVDPKALEQVIVQGQGANVANVAPVSTEITAPRPDTTAGLPTPAVDQQTLQQVIVQGQGANVANVAPVETTVPSTTVPSTVAVATPTPAQPFPTPTITPVAEPEKEAPVVTDVPTIRPDTTVGLTSQQPDLGRVNVNYVTDPFVDIAPPPDLGRVNVNYVTDPFVDIAPPTELDKVTVTAKPEEPVVESPTLSEIKAEEPEKPKQEPKNLYPTVTSIPPRKKPRAPSIITGASPARLLADALAAYRPAGAIEGEESGKERQNVWNEKSLRLKDALGL